MLSPQSRDNNENRNNGYHGYHRIERQRDRATRVAPMMPAMATTNAAAASLDSIWTPRRQFHTNLEIYTNGRKCLKQGMLEVVAREGFGWHYTLKLPVNGIYLNPRLDQGQYLQR
jgi:hypothetical protein